MRLKLWTTRLLTPHSNPRRVAGVFVLLVWIIAAFPRGDAGVPPPSAGPGITYTHIEDVTIPLSIHVVKIDRARSDFEFRVTLGGRKHFGVASVAEQAASVPRRDGYPVAAVNGDYFSGHFGPYQGIPAGLNISHGELFTAPAGPCFWIDAAGQPHIAKIYSTMKVIWPNGQEMPLGLNQERKENAAVLYTPALGSTTRTSGGRELILIADRPEHWLPLRVGEAYAARVLKIEAGGDSPIRDDTVVLSIGPKLLNQIPVVQPGDRIQFTTTTLPELKDVQTGIGGGPILASEGKAYRWPSPQPRNPLTGIGWNDHSFFLVAVDGRRQDVSLGMNYPEFAQEMLRLGCTEAMSFDGGGSATLWLDGRIMNLLSGIWERRVADALIVVRVPPANSH